MAARRAESYSSTQADEHTPLLHSEGPPPSQSFISRLKTRYLPLPLLFRFAPVVFLATLGVNFPAMAGLDFFEKLVCAIWFMIHDPDSIPPNGEIPPELCHAGGSATAFSWVLSIQALLISVLCEFIIVP